MSGYRSLHREKVGDYPIWHVVSSPLLSKASSTLRGKSGPTWRIWAACGDGLVRGFLVREKSLETQSDVLDASACTCTCTHLLLGESQQVDQIYLGCTQLHLIRNYVGDDDMAGDYLVVSIDLTGRIRIWCLPETMDDDDTSSGGSDASNGSKPRHIRPVQDFVLENATGTSFQICPPKVSGVGDVLLAVARLDGTIAVIATGLSTPKASKQPILAGTIIDVWSKVGPIAMSSDWHPFQKCLAVGRQDGLVEILGDAPHRLIHHEAPVRAVRFTPDANLLVTASDDGMLAVWDLGRSVPVLVNHIVQAHASWILNMTTLSDSRRFLTCGADRKLNVWSAGKLHQSMHTFTCDDTVWTIHSTTTLQRGGANISIPPRLVSGSESGSLQIYSLEA